MKRLLRAIPIAGAIAAVVLLARPNPFSLIIGGIIVFVGEAFRVWASGHLFRNKELTTSGPYAHLRDPLYLGRVLLLVGFCVMAWGHSWIVLVLGLAVFFLRYMPRKYRKEMVGLEELFGEEYRKYSAYTPSLVPRLKAYPHARKRPWRFDLFWNQNREQYFLSGVVVLISVIVGRYYTQ